MKPRLFPPTLTENNRALIGHNYSVHQEKRTEWLVITYTPKGKLRQVRGARVHTVSKDVRYCESCETTICHHVAAVDTMMTLIGRKS